MISIKDLIKYYIKHPREFYSKSRGIIFSYLLQFKWYEYSKSIKNLINTWNPVKYELKKNWNCYSFLYNKYKDYLNDLPIYNEGNDRENKIWWCRLQGEENAPKLNKSCLKSVREFIKGKEIAVITSDNLSDYVKFPKYIIQKHNKWIMPNAHFSDLVRLELLIRYWWTWIDSSVLLTWYEKTFFDSDFFMFNNFESWDDSIVSSNWFITSNKNNPILLTTRDLLFKYWEENNYLINYFIFHLFFTMATKKYSEIWNKVPKYSNIPPHTMQREFLQEYNKERFKELKKISSVHKLNHKINRKNLAKNSLFEYIENM